MAIGWVSAITCMDAVFDPCVVHSKPNDARPLQSRLKQLSGGGGQAVLGQLCMQVSHEDGHLHISLSKDYISLFRKGQK